MQLTMDWGNPTFLSEYWENKRLQTFDVSVNNGYLRGNLIKLEKNIRILHKNQKNCKVDGKYIVVGNGATQILSGLMHVLTNYNKIYAQAPYFSRFPTIANINFMSWDKVGHKNSLQILTYPNNPDGSTEINLKCDKIIYDLTYNWSTYGKTINFDEDICVFSLSKATGHASARIGWAVVEDKQLAEDLTNYIEHTSNGISFYSQEIACFLLEDCIKYEDNVFLYGKKELNYRWNVINSLNLPFDVLNSSGMFLWCKGKCPPQLIGMPGYKFGASDEYFRLNLGSAHKNIEKLKEMYGK